MISKDLLRAEKMIADSQIAPPIRFLGASVTIVIDRPMGSRHPKWDFIYPINYGYIPGVPAPDGEELDAYLLGVFESVEEFSGICIAIIHRLNDADDKLVIVPDGVAYSDDQIRALTEFQERFFQSEIIR
jgi:inorganic pyrophosphatase